MKKTIKTAKKADKKAEKVVVASKDFKSQYPTLANNPNKWTNRLVISTPTVGMVRMEWVQGRFGQTIPTNFSLVDVHQYELLRSNWVPIKRC
jgi:hypothetical protein